MILIYRFAPVIEEKVRKRLEQVKIELIVSSTDDILRIRLFWSIYSILNYWIILYIILVIISLKKNKLRNNSITDLFHIPEFFLPMSATLGLLFGAKDRTLGSEVSFLVEP